MAKYVPKIDLATTVAIDIHTHAEVSSCHPPDPERVAYDKAFAKYFKRVERPKLEEIATFYRERKMVAVVFTVDTEATIHVTGLVASYSITQTYNASNIVTSYLETLDP